MIRTSTPPTAVSIVIAPVDLAADPSADQPAAALVEYWRAIPSAPTCEASDLGRVRVRETGRVLREIDRGGRGTHRYRGVRIPGRRVPVALHHAVAEAWVGRRPRGACINHINGNRCDNRAMNLEWSTDRANKRHAAALGLIRRGEGVASARLTTDQVGEIRRLRGAATRAEVAAAYGVAAATVQDVWSRKSWRWLP